MGDEVFGVAPGCLGRSIIVTQHLVVPKPPNISFEDAATTPTVYVTVFQAFGDFDTFTLNTKVSFIFTTVGLFTMDSISRSDAALLLQCFKNFHLDP